MTLRAVARRTTRRWLARAGFRVTRIPPVQTIPPGVLPAQGVDGFGTHFVPLAAAVARTAGGGPVLELGTGDHSTPLLHLMCHDRVLVSADSNEAWLRRYERFRSKRHELHYVSDWDQFALIEAHHWSVALVDCSPTHERVGLISRLRSRATFVIVHDTDTDTDAAALYGFESALNEFRYRSDYRVFRPFTSIVSDERPFELTEADAPVDA
jgi:hypothetical protein